MSRWSTDLRMVGAFLTILPVGPRTSDDYQGSLAAAAWCFPLVGLAVGLLAGLSYGLVIWLGGTVWVAATLSVTVLVLLCGAMHEDGLGDFADGLGGTNRERRLTIMRDSQAGNFAVVALLLVFAARIGAVAALGTPGLVLSALISAAAMSRTAMVVGMRLLPPARLDGLGASAGRPSDLATWLSVAVGFAIAWLFLGFAAALAAAVGAVLAGGIIGILARRRFGGQTGDVLGATQVTAEVGCLLAVIFAI